MEVQSGCRDNVNMLGSSDMSPMEYFPFSRLFGFGRRAKKGRRGTHPDGQAEQLQHTQRHFEADNCCSPLH